MKTLYIPKGESRTYETLAIDRIVVHGELNVANGIKAKRVTGHGYLTAGSISADVIAVDDVEAARITCKRLLTKRVYAAEVYASDSVVTSCSLTAAYVETGKLTTALSEIDEVKAEEVVNLRPRRRGMLLTLMVSALVTLWLSLTMPREKTPKKAKQEEPKTDESPESAEEAAVREQIGKTVREIMKENGIPADGGDLALKKLVSSYLLLRSQGFTLSVRPVAETAPPLLDFEQEKQGRIAA